MKRLIVLIALVLLTGCNSMRQAKAEQVRATTRRTNEIHAQQMADNNVLAADRIAAKMIILWSLTTSGVIILISASLAGSWALIGFSLSWVREQANKANIQTIPLNPITRQFDLIIYQGNRAYDPNTGQRVLLDRIADPQPMLVAGTYQVRLNGVSSQKVIEGR